ncbi:MerR family DNA-binding transcriptional regulator [Paenibacillus puldeungensis]|uniref:MerR family DNA-binding transcriptional regulator n=1 Tax=Paenibacillus puldeungensis TaxID=696536 RepID=A0ABW3RTL5_9BACL
MELQTISQVSKHFSISTRTLRYYEQIGLITPLKKEDFAYRVYDIEAITRLRQIIILRVLQSKPLRATLSKLRTKLPRSPLSVALLKPLSNI